ncbi:Meiotically up-regulated protein 157 [Exophiala dermatitidis]
MAEATSTYTEYAGQAHRPYSDGSLKLPFQRPAESKRTYHSAGVEGVIANMTARMSDKDLARMFENCFPNTLDTTVKWFSESNNHFQSFIIAGDMDAAWLRDNLWQIQAYTSLLSVDTSIQKLWKGVINLHSTFLSQAPYTNSFQPPRDSGIVPVSDHVVDLSQDIVYPPTDPAITFEAKYALDSLAAFLRISNTYVQETNDRSVLNEQWLTALTALLTVLHEQSQSTFDDQYQLREPPAYSFQRPSALCLKSVYNGPDQPPNSGTGNPVASGTGLIKSMFRASDDATIFPFHIPSNAMISVELGRTSQLIHNLDTHLSKECSDLSARIRHGIFAHGTTDHPLFGAVFAYEVDGYGSRVLMDDASPPSLLSLPYLGFLDRDDPIYQNTRRMVLSPRGNPYYLVGSQLEGQGSPHIDLKTMWPIGTIMQILTSDDDAEICRCLDTLKRSSGGLGLVHEGVNVNDCSKFLRTWYAWGNSAFGEMILYLAERKPELLFGQKQKETVAASEETELDDTDAAKGKL